MSQLPTIKIQHPELEGEFIIINEEDFDPSKHKKFVEPKTTAKAPPTETAKADTAKGKAATTKKDADSPPPSPPAA